VIPEYEIQRNGEVYQIADRYNRERMDVWLDYEGRAWVLLFVQGRVECVPLNRLVCTSFRGPPPSPTEKVAHLNGRRGDCSLANVAWATSAVIRRLPRVRTSPPLDPTLNPESHFPAVCRRVGLAPRQTFTLTRGWLAGCEVEFFRCVEPMDAGFSYGQANGFMKIRSFRPSMLGDTRPRDGNTITLQL
jgi:hypothetical protein